MDATHNLPATLEDAWELYTSCPELRNEFIAFGDYCRYIHGRLQGWQRRYPAAEPPLPCRYLRYAPQILRELYWLDRRIFSEFPSAAAFVKYIEILKRDH